MRFKSHPRNQKENHPIGWFFFLILVQGVALRSYGYETDERSSLGKHSERIRGMIQRGSAFRSGRKNQESHANDRFFRVTARRREAITRRSLPSSQYSQPEKQGTPHGVPCFCRYENLLHFHRRVMCPRITNCNIFYSTSLAFFCFCCIIHLKEV